MEVLIDTAECYQILLEWDKAKNIYDKFDQNDFGKWQHVAAKINHFIEFYLMINKKGKATLVNQVLSLPVITD